VVGVTPTVVVATLPGQHVEVVAVAVGIAATATEAPTTTARSTCPMPGFKTLSRFHWKLWLL
jgi:hypothetical protein